MVLVARLSDLKDHRLAKFEPKSNPDAEELPQCCSAIRRDLNRAALVATPDPVALERKAGNRSPDAASQVHASFAPIETGPAESATAVDRQGQVDARPARNVRPSAVNSPASASISI